MGKALVMRRVDFSANKLATVTVIENVHCTGIALSRDSISFTSLTTATLTAELTPAETTDPVMWSSSNNNIVTVDDGVVTAVGLGNAVITVTCGQRMAECTVNVTCVLTSINLATIDHRVLSGTDLNAGKDYCGTYTTGDAVYQKMFVYLSSEQTPSKYKAISGTDENYLGKYPIIIPKNTATIEIVNSGSPNLSVVACVFLNSSELTTYITGTSQKGCKALTNSTSYYASNNKVIITPPEIEGLDSFIFCTTLASATDPAPTTLTITFKS